MNENIVQYARDNFNLLIGERTAEEVKIQIGSAYVLAEPLCANSRRDLILACQKK